VDERLRHVRHGKAAMVVTHTVDANRFQDPRRPEHPERLAVAPPPKWDASKPEEYHASYFDIDGYMINKYISDPRRPRPCCSSTTCAATRRIIAS